MYWLAFASCVAAVTSAGTAVVAIRIAATTFQRGAELQAFLMLTGRYEAIMSELPPAARVSDDWEPDTDENFAIRLKYLNLCSEEFYSKETKLLSRAVWDIWENELRATLASPPYVEAWAALACRFESHPAFKTFVEAAR